MHIQEAKSAVKKLIFQLPSPPESPVLGGTSVDNLKKFEEKTTVFLPPDVQEWLLFSNGSLVGPGGIYGLNDDKKYFNIEDQYEYYPNWKRYAWIPIAGDGCGNSYVVISDKSSQLYNTICFVDTMLSTEKLLYVVASNIWFFLYFIFIKELKGSGWPFEKNQVLSIDSELSGAEGVPLPWEAD